MLLAWECFPLKLLPEDVSDLCHVLFFTLFCAMFHAILVIAISLQTYGQEYFMNEEVSGIYNITSSHLYENCNLKISKYFVHVIAECIQKLAKKSVLQLITLSAPSIRQHFFHSESSVPTPQCFTGSIRSEEGIFRSFDLRVQNSQHSSRC